MPLRFAASPADDPALADLILSRAQEISRNPSDEVILLLGYGAGDDGIVFRSCVVPLLAPPSAGDQTLERFLQGHPYDVATSGALSDARLVEWLTSVPERTRRP